MYWSTPIVKYNLAQGDFDAAREMILNKKIEVSGEVEEDWVNLKQVILDARDQFVPKRFVGKRTWKDEFPPDTDTFRLLKEKNKAYYKWLHNHNTDLRIRYNRLRKKSERSY